MLGIATSGAFGIKDPRLTYVTSCPGAEGPLCRKALRRIKAIKSLKLMTGTLDGCAAPLGCVLGDVPVDPPGNGTFGAF